MVRKLTRFALSRVIIGVSALLVSSFVVFAGLYLAPGSPTDFLLGNRPASPELVAQVREQYRLDEPFLTQYGLWLRDAVHGDFGASASSTGVAIAFAMLQGFLGVLFYTWRALF